MNIIGSNGNDTISDTIGNDVIDALGGDDFITITGGTDVINGGDGNDTLIYAGGNFTFYGELGIDTIASDGLAYTVAYEHTTTSIYGGPPAAYVLRVTTVR